MLSALTISQLLFAALTLAQTVPKQAQVVDQRKFNVLQTVLPPFEANATTLNLPPGLTKQSAYAKPFHIYNDAFYDIIGGNPTLTVIASQGVNPLFHEAVVWYPPTDEMFFVQNAGAKAAGTGLNKSAIISKIALSQAAPLTNQRNASGKVDVITVPAHPTVINPNGATNYKGKILFTGEGQGNDTAPALYWMNPVKPYNTTVVLNNYFGRQFNSPNDVAISPTNGDIYFTDTVYGWLQDFRPSPGLKNSVYRFNPNTGAVTVVADEFDKPNGIQFSPNGSYAYVTDTGAQDSNYGFNQSAPTTIYRYTVASDGTFENRKLFAYPSPGLPDGIKCDNNGNVYAGVGDGIQVWNPSGTLLGKIYVGATSANFAFAGKGRMVICAETNLFYVTLAAEGVCDRELPCQNCRTRSVAAKCFYQPSKAGLEVRSPRAHGHSRHHIPSPPTDEVHLDRSEESNLLEHIGYSEQANNAVVSTLNHLLGGDDSQIATPNQPCYQFQPGKWLDFRKLVDDLPPTDVAQALVQVFFSEANWYFAVLDQYFFDRVHVSWIAYVPNLSTTTKRTSIPFDLVYFPALLFQVLAMAMQFLPPGFEFGKSANDDKVDNYDEISKNFSDKGSALIDLLGRHNPTITAVQADLIRCAWLKNNGKGTDSWFSLGYAVRQAQELGLHLQVERPDGAKAVNREVLHTLWHDEHKKRLWVILFTWESHMALQLGRPRMINESDCTITPPIDCDFPLEPARTLFEPTQTDERPSFYTLRLVNYKTGKMIHKMMSTGVVKGRVKDFRAIQGFHDDILTILETLPKAMYLKNPDVSWDQKYPGLVKQRLQISIVANYLLLALHKPHADTSAISREAAIEAATQCLDNSQQLFEVSQVHHHKIYTLVYYTVDAGIFLAAAVARFPPADSNVRKRIGRTLDDAVLRLGILKKKNNAAYFGEKVLASCIRQLQRCWKKHDENVVDQLLVEVQPKDFNLNNTGLQHSNDIGTTSLAHEFPAILDDDVELLADEDPWNGRDLFSDVTNARVDTAGWLEHLDMMSSLDFGIDDDKFLWDTIFQ